MTAASPLPTVPTLDARLQQLKAVKDELAEAHCLNTHALQNVAHAKRTLERARAELLVRGVEGKNEAVREAQLRIELDAQHNALADAEDQLNEARFNLEAVRLEWDVLRYSVRCLELSSMSH